MYQITSGIGRDIVSGSRRLAFQYARILHSRGVCFELAVERHGRVRRFEWLF